ncbi:hypothetical protein C8Q76DRAFT_694494 [Earliella scabrosa]|nr:hypothetical protein C8Q76DRAFT_694494 [Earliella scabrosa]
MPHAPRTIASHYTSEPCWLDDGRAVEFALPCHVHYCGFTLKSDVFEPVQKPHEPFCVGQKINFYYTDHNYREVEVIATLGPLATANLREVEFLVYRRSTTDDAHPYVEFTLRVQREWTGITVFGVIRAVFAGWQRAIVGRFRGPAETASLHASTVVSDSHSTSSRAATPVDGRRDRELPHQRSSSTATAIRIIVTEATTVVSAKPCQEGICNVMSVYYCPAPRRDLSLVTITGFPGLAMRSVELPVFCCKLYGCST